MLTFDEGIVVSAPYILDEIPLWGDMPFHLNTRLATIPSLRKHLFSQQYSTTIYGEQQPQPWTVSATAYSGKEPFEFWMQSSVSLLARLGAIIQFSIILTKPISTEAWVGKSVDVNRGNGAEGYLLLYSHQQDVSLELHLAHPDVRRRQLRERGLQILTEIQVA